MKREIKYPHELIGLKPSVAFKAGAEWQKDKMLKDAVEGEVGKDGILTLSNGEAVDLSPSLDKIAFGLQPSQKVRIVVLKEEEDLE